MVKIKTEWKDYLKTYNDKISQIACEFDNSLASLASPTLNKQETISFLYSKIIRSAPSYLFLQLKNRALFLPRLIFQFLSLIVISKIFKIRKINVDIYIRTWLVPKSFQNGKIKDDYFRELIDDLNEQTSMVLAFQPLKIDRLMWKFKKDNTNQNFIIPIGLLGVSDICLLFLDYIKTAKLRLKKEYFYKKKSINKLVNQSLEDDYYKLRSFPAFLESYITEKILKLKPKRYLYIFENQAWEKAALFKLENEDIKTFGYQSSGFSVRFLNFFPSPSDLSSMIFPDRILTVGHHYKNLLDDLGNYPDIIENFAALRFNYLFDNDNLFVRKSNPRIFKRIIYAFAVHKYQYLTIIDKLVQIFGNSDVQVFLKYHPLHSDYKHNRLPKNFMNYSNFPGGEKRNFFDFVLFNDNSFGVECLAEGLKSYEFIFGEDYPEDRLIDFDQYKTKMEVAELLILKQKLLDGSFDKGIDANSIRGYLKKNYSPYNKTKLSILDK